eukprot:TRINITY_DN7981_c0_g1_i1.p1 TRINITY_DN7981_c0_g1~~TRINITY_DN7981_c0_g1_i1.p1  ORF type:complete len:192 (-),score=33.98 TRINITY_DN7981_c0_g1_i1:52-627(-)
MSQKVVKCVLVGSSKIGKSCLVVSYTTGFAEFTPKSTSTVFDVCSANVTIGSKRQVDLQLWESSGCEEYQHLRTLSYRQTDVFLACFSITSQESFNRVKSQWVPEIRHYCPKAPIILVGLQSDARDGEAGAELVDKEEALSLAKEIGAAGYFECSAFSQEGTKDVFDGCIRVALGLSKEPDGVGCNRCSIL